MRVVLDTNVVLDLVVFDDPGARALREAIATGRVKPLADPGTLAELRRVLGYPAFNLDAARQETAFGWYESRAERIDTPVAQSLLPRCRDADDQKFLDLAWAANAAHLLTKDRALLALARRVAKLGRFSVALPSTIDWAGQSNRQSNQ